MQVLEVRGGILPPKEVRVNSQKERATVLLARRDQIVKLAKLQRELFDAFEQRCSNDAEILAFANQTNRLVVDVKVLLRRERSICSGRTLQQVTEYVGRPDLKAAIEAATEGLGDRDKGLSLLPEDVLDTLGRIRYERAVDYLLSTKDFCKPFGRNASTVANALTLALEKVPALGKVLDEVNAVLDSVEYRERNVDKTAERKAVAYARFQELFTPLVESGVSYGEITAYCQLGSGTLLNARTGESGEKTYIEIIAKLETLCKERDIKLDGAAEVVDPPEAVVMTGPDQHKIPAGFPVGETIGNVRFVLTPDSFQEIFGDPGELGVAFAVKAIEVCRGALNAMAQIKNDDVRRRVRAALSPQVEELEFSIRTFTAVFPSRAVGIFQAQRDALRKDQKAVGDMFSSPGKKR